MASATGPQKLILHTPSNNKNAWKALIAGQYVGAKIEVPSNFDWAKTKTPEFLKLNPNGKVGEQTSATWVRDIGLPLLRSLG